MSANKIFQRVKNKIIMKIFQFSDNFQKAKINMGSFSERAMGRGKFCGFRSYFNSTIL
jgi:hypothetical protein